MRTHTPTRVVLWMSLAATLLLWPGEALAQRGHGGHGGGGGARPAATGQAVPRSPSGGSYYRPSYYRPYYRPYYYRPYYYSPYYYGVGYGFGLGFYGSYYGAYGWSPYYPYWGYPYPYGGYYGTWYDNLGSLRIEVKPREAQVYVDGYFAGLVDDFDGFSQRLRAKPGEHQLELYMDGYQPVKELVQFRPGVTIKLKAELKPLGPGEAPAPKPQPIAPPDDASTGPDTRDQPYRNARPYRNAPPPPNVNVEPPQAAAPDEQAPGRSGFGTLSIRVQPRDAVVLIDGERWEGGDSRERLVIEVTEGTHRIEVQKAGYTSYSTEVRVRRGQVSTVNVALSTAHEV